MVEFFRPYPRRQPKARHHGIAQYGVSEYRPDGMNRYTDRGPYRNRANRAHDHPADNPADHVSREQLTGRNRGHQDIDDISLNLGNHDGRRCVRKGVLHHGHHDEARCEKRQIRNIANRFGNAAKGQCKHGVEQQSRDNGGYNRLGVDIQKTPHLLTDQGFEADHVDGRNDARLEFRADWYKIIVFHELGTAWVMQENIISQDMADEENIKPRKARREKKPPKKITEKYLYNSGLAYLQRFPASTPHFKRVMGRKIDRSCNYHKEQSKEESLTFLEKTVETFIRMGLLNDDAYLLGMITSLRRRGLSTQAILSKMSQKGMTQDRVLETLRAHDETTGVSNPDLAAATLLMRRKRIGPYRKTADFDKNKELAGLARAGFGFDIAQKALGLGPEEAEEILSQIRS